MKQAHVGHGTAGAGTLGMHVGHGRSYDVLHHLVLGSRRRRALTRLANFSGVRSGDRVLDVGCGTGTFTREMAEAAAPGGTALGVDASREAIAHARRLTHHPNCTFSEGIAEALDATDGSYDVVVSSLMIHHLREPMRPQAIREMFRVLRPGGRVLIADFRPPTRRIGRHLIGLVTSPAMQNNPVHLLDLMVREAGFEQALDGDVHPWIRYVQAAKPTSAP
jgi:ubiquinone/menaquinone biosynthesis C-methylase UbiE